VVPSPPRSISTSSMNSRTLAFSLLLLMPLSSWADPQPGITHYDNGEYEEALRAFEQLLDDPNLPPDEKGLARIYLAASLHVLGRVEAAQQQLVVLAREHPELRVDLIRFPPELVALAEGIRERVAAEKRYAEQEALSKAMAEEAARNRPPPLHLRVEGLGLSEPSERVFKPGVGFAISRGLVEGSARMWFGGTPIFHLQGGLVPGSSALRPHLGLRAVLIPGTEGYGAGVVVGGRFTLAAHLLALVDVGADYFLVSDEAHRRFAVTAQAGLAFDLVLP
jgi:tetratricopeptide (TPR) repeat protein